MASSGLSFSSSLPALSNREAAASGLFTCTTSYIAIVDGGDEDDNAGDDDDDDDDGDNVSADLSVHQSSPLS